MLLTICSVAQGSLYHSELAVLSTGCQHFAWLAVCRKWLKTGLDYKSWPRAGQIQCYHRPVLIYKPTTDSLQASVQICCSLQIISIPDKIKQRTVSVPQNQSNNQANAKIERRSRNWQYIMGEHNFKTSRLITLSFMQSRFTVSDFKLYQTL